MTTRTPAERLVARATIAGTSNTDTSATGGPQLGSLPQDPQPQVSTHGS